MDCGIYFQDYKISKAYKLVMADVCVYEKKVTAVYWNVFVMQIEPLERAIKEKKIRILELEESLEMLLKKKTLRGKAVFQYSCKFFRIL